MDGGTRPPAVNRRCAREGACPPSAFPHSRPARAPRPRIPIAQTTGALLLGGVCALIIGGAFAAGEAARGGPIQTAAAAAPAFGLRGLIDADALEAPTLRGALADARDLEYLTQAVYYESRGGPETGQAAVAQVVLNRTRTHRYPGSVCGVVFQHVRRICQFSFACDGSVSRPRERAAWARSEAVARRALGGERRAGIGDATQFRVAGLSSNGLVRVARIGAHVFYNLAHGVRARTHEGRVNVQLAAAPELAKPPTAAGPADATPVKVSVSTPAAPASATPAA